MYSLRRTLSVRFSLTMLAALLLIALWAYLGARQTLIEELDQSLANGARVQAVALNATGSLPAIGTLDRGEFTRDVNRFMALRSSSGVILQVNTPLARDLPLNRPAFYAALKDNVGRSTETWLHEPARSVYLRVASDPHGAQRVLQVTASLAPLVPIDRHLLALLLGTVALGTLATAMGSGWLARSATDPIDSIAEQAEALEAGSVGQRITAHADITEFARLIRVLNGLLERLDAAFLSQQRIIADVGHDLRTPVTAMRGEIEIALRGNRPVEAYRKVLASTLEEVDHLGAIAESLILLARIEAGETNGAHEFVDLGALADAAVERARARADGHTVRRGALTGSQDTTLRGDEKTCGLVLDHLIGNAIQHTASGTTVDVLVGSDQDSVTLVVEDNGAGVSPQVLPHLFERFYRGDEARGRSGGAGLGLTLVSAVAQAHKGRAEASAGAAGGLRVTVRMPRVPS